MTGEAFRLPGPGGALALVLHRPPSGPAPCVLACHGHGATKDTPAWLALATALPAAGLALARLDFRGCGDSDGVEEDTTIATRLDDLEAALAFLARQPGLDGRLGLVGAGLGGFVALHAAARRPGLPVVTWGAPASLTELANDELPDSGRLGVPFALEYLTGRYALAPRGVPCHLVVHGEADTVIGLEHGVALHAQAREPVELLLVAGGDHALSDPAHRARAVEASRDWFRRWLGPQTA